MENRKYNERRSQLAHLLSASLVTASQRDMALSENDADSVAYSIVNLVESLCHEQQRDELRGKWVIDPMKIPGEVFNDFLHFELRFRVEDEASDEPVELFEVIKDLKRDAIRHNLKADGYKVWSAVNGHELFGMEGESSAYAQHSDACGCMWLDAGDEPWEPMGDW
jgi:hypothetical protein